VGIGSSWPTHDTEGPSSGPNNPFKRTWASKDRVLTTWIHGTLSVETTCHHAGTVLLSGELTQRVGVPRHFFISHRYLFTQVRTSAAEEMAGSGSHRHYCPRAGPLGLCHIIYNARGNYPDH